MRRIPLLRIQPNSVLVRYFGSATKERAIEKEKVFNYSKLTYYDILRVPENASETHIRRSYIRLAK